MKIVLARRLVIDGTLKSPGDIVDVKDEAFATMLVGSGQAMPASESDADADKPAKKKE